MIFLVGHNDNYIHISWKNVAETVAMVDTRVG